MDNFSSENIHPKILCIDFPAEIIKKIKECNFNVTEGSFGRLFRVTKSSSVFPILQKKGDIPLDVLEKEVVFINLTILNEHFRTTVSEETEVPVGITYMVQKADKGIINPRPLSIGFFKEKCTKILDEGGAVIIFSDSEIQCDYASGHYGKLPYGKTFHPKDNHHCSNWDFLPDFLTIFPIENSHGSECRIDSSIECVPRENQFWTFLANHVSSFSYSCSFPNFHAVANDHQDQFPIIQNKFGVPVGGVIMAGKEKKGIMILLPGNPISSEICLDLLKNTLPDLSPHLFPGSKGSSWVFREEYELAVIVKLKKKIKEKEQEVEDAISKLKQEVSSKRDEFSFLTGLLIEHGDKLVQSAKKTLEFLGFTNVIDVDEEINQGRRDGPKGEDLQILEDGLPTLLIEVKGISGKPSEEDALTVQKYLFPESQRTQNVNICGLSLINHQKHLPPADREIQHVFTSRTVENAIGHKIGLLTTFSLWKLTRNFIHLSWNPAQIKPLFYKKGHFQVFPEHYEYLGEISKVWPQQRNIIGMEISNGTIAQGDKLALEYPLDFIEATIHSLEVNDLKVDKVTKGDKVGIEISSEIDRKIEKGIKVYRLK